MCVHVQVCVIMYVHYHVNAASQYVTASGVTLLIRQNTEQGDTYDEIALKEYSMDALKAVISGKTMNINMPVVNSNILVIKFVSL